MNKILLVIIIIITLFFFNISSFTPISTLRSYTDLKNDSWSYTPGGIPKIIIKTSWQSRDKFPKEIADVLNSSINLNPEYKHYYFDSVDKSEFMKNEFSDNIYNCYEKIIPGAFKADLFRLCVLYKYGGCYSDIGHVMKVGFNSICESSNLVLVKERNKLFGGYYGVHNALICTIPMHPFFHKLIDKICENINNNYYGDNALDVTGPSIMGKVYNCFFMKDCEFKRNGDMEVGDTVINNLKIKILLVRGEVDGVTDIIDKNGNIILLCKFPNYYNIMYDCYKRIRYGYLWNDRKIYL